MPLVSPYDDCRGPWLKGNLHTHTRRSDGRQEPQEVVDRYAAAGWDFLALTDHDICTPPPADDRLIWLSGVEISANGPHMLAIGVDHAYDTAPPRQALIDQVIADGGLCILNHPNWGPEFVHWPQADLEHLLRYNGLEIHNSVVERLEGNASATDRWDRLLSIRHWVWGYATDDLHDLPDGPRSYCAVCTAERTPAAVMAALRCGRFYASTGLDISRIAVAGNVLTVEAPEADTIRFVGRWGVVLDTVHGPAASYEVRARDGFVRAECHGSRLRTAYTQPVRIESA
ncbi:MAG: CehA/McbA family metallohydrolase [Armatimonadetes bacterium]|nr:CehA/McbA family metallohydrolase [Armatimonadota bacterium]